MIRFILSVVIVMISSTSSSFAQSEETVNVFRWRDAVHNLYVTATESGYDDSQLIKEGCTNKTFIFKAFCDPGPDRVAVYNWYNAFTWSHLCIAENEYSDSIMREIGYSQKRFQFYALTKSDQNTISVYRWLMPHGLTWITVPEYANTDGYFKKGYRRKTYQYYAIAR